MLMKPNKAETGVGGLPDIYAGAMVVRMRAVMATLRVHVVCVHFTRKPFTLLLPSFLLFSKRFRSSKGIIGE